MRILTKQFYFLAIFTFVGGALFAQNGGLGSGVNKEFPITTTVPFLRIIPDARAGGMGDAGIAVADDASAIFHNPANLAFVKKPLSFSISYVPWLRQLVKDIFLAHLAGYYKIDKFQTVGLSMKYFSLGKIQFTNQVGENTVEFNPNEFAIDAAYARKLVDIKKGGGFSAGIALRFIYSNLATGQAVNDVAIKPGIAGSADISFAYNQDFKIQKKYKTNLAMGLNLSNIGSKITYTESAEKDFIPMNLGFGVRYQFNVDDYNQINLAVDMNKLLVPTPQPYITDSTSGGRPVQYDDNGNGILDYREVSVPKAIFTSFSDAPGGASEEFHEMMWSIGAEYWYDQMFAVRFGYFYEHESKGNRKFFTAGLGVRYSVFGLDFSYLIPTSTQRNPLDNTFRFTLLFNFDNIKRPQEAEPTDGTSMM